jgi:tetratricopeptide (TPR) repeat protein
MRRILLVSLILLTALAWSGEVLAQDAEYNLGIIIVKDKALAESLRQRLGKGEDFEQLARDNSVGPNARRGGRLGVVKSSSLRGEYRNALQGLKPGQTSKVIAIEDGYTLLQVFSEAAARPRAEGPPPAVAAPRGSGPAANLAPPLPQSASEERRLRFMVNPVTSQAINIDLLGLVVDALEFMQKGELKRAAASLTQASSLAPNDDTAPLLLGLVEEGIAGNLSPQLVARMADAFGAMVSGEGPLALEIFTALGQEHPKLWQAHLMEGSLSLESGDLENALAQLRQVEQLKPDYARTYLVIGNVYYAQFKGQEAEAAYVQALQLNPGLADGYYFLGRLFMAHGQVEFAEQEYRRALEIDPLMYDAYNDLGYIYLYSNRPQEAEEAFVSALRVNPGMVPALIHLGILYASQSKWDKSKSLFELAIERNNLLPEAHYNLGLVYIHEKNWSQARAAIDQAANLGYEVPEAVMKMLTDGEAGQ